MSEFLFWISLFCSEKAATTARTRRLPLIRTLRNQTWRAENERRLADRPRGRTQLSLGKEGATSPRRSSPIGAVSGRVVRSKVTNGGGLRSCPTFTLVSVSDATWPVSGTRALTTVSPRCRSRSRRGSPSRTAGSACWPSLGKSWGFSSSSPPLLPRKPRVRRGEPEVGRERRKAPGCKVYWSCRDRGCSVSCGFESHHFWTASLLHRSTARSPRARVPFSSPGSPLPRLNLVTLDDSCCRSSCDYPQWGTTTTTGKTRRSRKSFFSS